MAKKTEKELEIQRLDKKTPLQMFWDYVMITVASFIYAVSVSMFLDPNSLAPGGYHRYCHYFKPFIRN